MDKLRLVLAQQSEAVALDQLLLPSSGASPSLGTLADTVEAFVKREVEQEREDVREERERARRTASKRNSGTSKRYRKRRNVLDLLAMEHNNWVGLSVCLSLSLQDFAAL